MAIPIPGVGYEKIVLVTRKTRLQGLIERFNSLGQARFTIERQGGDFADYVVEDDTYRRALGLVHQAIAQAAPGLKLQAIERALLPTYLFSDKDIVLAVGQDGLVANCAKYALGRPLFGVNPDPGRFDGVLLPFLATERAGDAGVARGLLRLLAGRGRVREVTLAQAALSDGQVLLGFNDLFIGAQGHGSARYRIRHEDRSEQHSSSGVIVSTGVGASGWLSSVWNMAAGVSAFCGGQLAPMPPLRWEDPSLLFVVREPFRSRHSEAGIAAGRIGEEGALVLESLMPSGGIIFSDGIEADFVAWNSGTTARVQVAAQKARLYLG